MSQQSVTLTFQDPAGNPLSNGRVVIRLQDDMAAVPPNVLITTQPVVNLLDINGSVTVNLWPTDLISPNTKYLVRAYSLIGELAWRGYLLVFSNAILLEDGTFIYLETGFPDVILLEV